MSADAAMCIADPDSCSKLSEVELQRACAPLYPPIAVDALANVILFIFFFNVALLTHVRGKLRSPTRALARMILLFVKDYFQELWETIKTIPWMYKQPLAARLRCCGNIDKAISIISMCVPLFAITRFLNIGNVNGARWVGYALTCPFMQMELIILIAPIVPCFCINALITFSLTFFCLAKAWIASTMPGDLYSGYFGDFVGSMDIDELNIQPKGYVIMPAMIGMAFIGFLQVPFLWLLYTCRGLGKRREDMPDDYRVLLMTVFFTWACFPMWWLFSWEGASIFKDAKLNEMGFMFLNMLAKGTFIYQSSRMAQKFEERHPEAFNEENDQVPDIVSKAHSTHRRRNSAVIATLERFTSDGHQIASSHDIGSIADVIQRMESEVNDVRQASKSQALSDHNYQEPAETTIMLRELLYKMDMFQEQLAETKKVAEQVNISDKKTTTWTRVESCSTAAGESCSGSQSGVVHVRRLESVHFPSDEVNVSVPPPAVQILDSIIPQPQAGQERNPAAVVDAMSKAAINKLAAQRATKSLKDCECGCKPALAALSRNRS
mmetsp:Transcript_17668/g.40941  ORF Transcript_17668/g.40941 Transcript_17668/m.40941 type:complete len:551 (-) Transcript_17668:93-1745(-)